MTEHEKNMSEDTSMAKFVAVFTITLVAWWAWLRGLENNPTLIVDATWNYNFSDWKILAATAIVGIMIFWIAYLIHSMKRLPGPLTSWAVVGLFFHAAPAVCLLLAVLKAGIADDYMLVYFSAVFAFRYWRLVVSCIFWCLYKVTPQRTDGKPDRYSSADCTVVVATVGPENHNTKLFTKMVRDILKNKPKRVVFATPDPDKAKIVEGLVRKIQEEFEAQQTESVKTLELAGKYPKFYTDIVCTGEANAKDKRTQTVEGIKHVQTKFIVMADDSVVWTNEFLEATLPAFRDDKVGFVGTKKWVEILPPLADDPNHGYLWNWCRRYWAGTWNTIGALYLIRHNFEIRSSSAADGGVFCVSGRTSLIRAEIVQDPEFTREFLNERVFELPLFGYKGFGPLEVDGDNFITRRMMKMDKSIKIQYSDDSTMTTVLGAVKNFKFIKQCERWSRTTIRQNPKALFFDLAIWWRWPITTWMTYFSWMINMSLFWDPLMLGLFWSTSFIQDSPIWGRWILLLGGWILLSKFIKTAAWFWKHPKQLKYAPGSILWGYFHSSIKIWTYFTFWKNDWAGRKEKPE